jgi:hypothetical protein
MTSTTALRVAWGIFSKLFLFPILPGPPQISTFVNEEARDRAAFRKILLDLANKKSRFSQLGSGRLINLLGFTYLYYRGSPADGPSKEKTQDQLAVRLHQAGFVYGTEEEHVSSLNLEVQHTELRQIVIGALEGPAGKELQLPERWQLPVFPTLTTYMRGNLFPEPRHEAADVLRYELKHLSVEQLNAEIDKLWGELITDPELRKEAVDANIDLRALSGLRREEVMTAGREGAGFDYTPIIVGFAPVVAKVVKDTWTKIILPKIRSKRGIDAITPTRVTKR